MRFVCDKCQAKYSIADERVLNKVIKLSCQKCGNEITVRGPTTQAAPAEPRRASAATMSHIQPIARSQPKAEGIEGAFDDMDDSEPKETTRIASLSELERIRAAALQEAQQQQKKSAPVDAPPRGEWMLIISGQQVGPFGFDAVKSKVKQGEVNARTYVWREGMSEWQRLQAVAELAALLPPAEPVKPVPPQRALAVADLVDPRIQSGESSRAATRGSAPTGTPAQTGAGNDFDTLFDAAEGGEALFGSGPLSLGGSGMRRNNLTDEPPREQTLGVIASAGLVQRKKKQRLYLAAAMAVVGLLLLLVVLDLAGVITIPAFGGAYALVGIDNPHPDPAPQFSDNLTEDERRRIREGLMGKKKAEASPVAASGAAMAVSGVTAPVPAKSPEAQSKAEDKVASDVFADDSKMALKLDPPRVRGPEGDLPAGIDAAAIKQVVEANQRGIKSCFERSLKRGANVGGRLELELSVANTGNVAAAEVKSSKHKDTEFAECVLGAVKAWKFPRFSGDPVTVEYPFILSTGN